MCCGFALRDRLSSAANPGRETVLVKRARGAHLAHGNPAEVWRNFSRLRVPEVFPRLLRESRQEPYTSARTSLSLIEREIVAHEKEDGGVRNHGRPLEWIALG